MHAWVLGYEPQTRSPARPADSTLFKLPVEAGVPGHSRLICYFVQPNLGSCLRRATDLGFLDLRPFESARKSCLLPLACALLPDARLLASPRLSVLSCPVLSYLLRRSPLDQQLTLFVNFASRAPRHSFVPIRRSWFDSGPPPPHPPASSSPTFHFGVLRSTPGFRPSVLTQPQSLLFACASTPASPWNLLATLFANLVSPDMKLALYPVR